MAVSTVSVGQVRRGFGQTERRDVWWIQPLLVFLGLSTFIVYATWAAFQGDHYSYGPYISPFYSPEIFGPSPHSWFQGLLSRSRTMSCSGFLTTTGPPTATSRWGCRP